MLTGELWFTYNIKYIRTNQNTMSKQNLEKSLRKELEVLNDVIDQRIIRGLSYTREARRHKFILSNLSNIQRARSGWMVRSLSNFSII